MRPALGLFQIVTFATRFDRGNPAFVATGAGRASDRELSALCDTLAAGVLAVVDGEGDDEPGLRFFTAEGLHPGAGHSTLAAAHVVFRHRDGAPAGEGRALRFRLASGDVRKARLEAGRISVAYPAMERTPVDRVDDLARALGGARPSIVFVSPFGYTAIFDNRDAVDALRPDFERVAALDRNAVIATAPGGAECDIVIRVFAPNLGLAEDPVCGTAHRIIVPYWAERLGRTRLHSRHLSRRGGDLWCESMGDDVIIAGESRLVVSGSAEIGVE